MRPVLIFTTLLVVVLASNTVRACSCVFGGRAACQEYWDAAAVFVGTVIDSRTITVKEGNYERQLRLVRLSLDEAFRGVEGAQVEVLTGFGGGDCGFGFQQAQQYLVYAFDYAKDGKLATGICTRTKSILKATEDLAYIRGLAKAKPGATINGEVVKYARDERGTVANNPLEGVKIDIQGVKNLKLLTDASGKYKAEGLPAGEYVVKVTMPEGLTTGNPERQVKVADRGCAVESFWLQSDGQLSGRVVNPQGLPVLNAEIFLLEADKERYRGHWDAAYSDESGKYSFKRIPPARYALQIRFDGLTSQNRPFPVIYYPGVSGRSHAKVITIAEGQRIENYDLEMPPLPPEFEITGTVLWSDERPVINARVEYSMVEVSVSYGVPLDGKAHFSFKAYEGLNLTMRASVEVMPGKPIYSEWVRVTAGPGTEPVKIVLSAP